jgi:hypothetical protein
MTVLPSGYIYVEKAVNWLSHGADAAVYNIPGAPHMFL